MKKIHLLINKIRPDMVRNGDMMSVEDVEEILAVPLIGVVPDDEQIVVCTNKGETVIGADCTSGQAFANISRRIMGEDVAFMELSGKKGFWSRLFKKS